MYRCKYNIGYIIYLTGNYLIGTVVIISYQRVQLVTDSVLRRGRCVTVSINVLFEDRFWTVVKL